MDDKHILYGLRLVWFIAFSLVMLCFYALANGKSLEPVSMIVTALVGIGGTLVGYFWGSSQHNNNNNNKTGGGVVALAAIVGASLLASSCSTLRLKRSSRSNSVTVSDSVVRGSVDKERTVRVRETQDTAIGVRGGSVSVRVMDGQLDSGGIKQRAADGLGLTLRAHKNIDGSVSIECTSDSLTLVIARLRRDSVYHQMATDSMELRYKASAVSELVSEREVRQRGGHWWLHLLLVLAGAAAGMTISKLVPTALKLLTKL
jgi:hypothetical protein